MNQRKLSDLAPHLILPAFVLVSLTYDYLSGFTRVLVGYLLAVLLTMAPAYFFRPGRESHHGYLYIKRGTVAHLHIGTQAQ